MQILFSILPNKFFGYGKIAYLAENYNKITN